ncbi:hypothetical protein MESS4_440027 [Mesorhizobium sp. STM 4661]|nr:hypothetical protein MESS4_440027 [Mesorhizobium sp. STM 4661]
MWPRGPSLLFETCFSSLWAPGRYSTPPVCFLRKRKLIHLPAKQKRRRSGRLQDFLNAPNRSCQRRYEMIRKLPLFSVVSGVLIRTSRIFIKFAGNPRDCWLCILNEFRRLPLVLALFSSN